jgi:hypothetical protein
MSEALSPRGPMANQSLLAGGVPKRWVISCPAVAAYHGSIARANFSPGQHRDLDKHLVEVDAAGSRRVRLGQRAGNGLLMMFLFVCLGLNALLLLVFLVLTLTGD